MGHLSYVEALVVGAFQGASELFPVSSLGHSVIVPAVVGGTWARDLNVSAPESPYLAFIVGLHVATALALLVFFWRDWLQIVGGLFTSIRHRRVDTPDERLAWLIILATIPVGLAGLALEHTFRTTLGRALPAAAFLAVNGLILLAANGISRRATTSPTTGPTEDDTAPEDDTSDAVASDARIAKLSGRNAVLVGASQILALLPGISRSGVAMVTGLTRGLSNEDAARFSFLLATPVILAAGVLKIPDLTGPLGAGIHGQLLAGAAASFVTALLAVRFLTRYFETRSLRPFGIYCLIAGIASFIYLAA